MNSKKSNQRNSKQLALAASVYNGPARSIKDVRADDSEIFDIQYIGTGFAASAGGVVNAVLDAYSSMSSSPDWTSIQNLWQEYRIVSYMVKFVPWNKYNQPTTTTLTSVATVLDRSSSSALTSYSDASGYASCELHPPSSNIVRTIKMNDVGEATFISTATSPATSDRLYVKFYSSGNTASVVLGDYIAFVRVQVRGRK